MTGWWVLLAALLAADAGAQPLGPVAPSTKIDARLRRAVLPGEPQHLYVRLVSTDAGDVRALAERGLAVEIVNPAFRLVQGWADAADVPAIAALPMVENVRPVDRARTRAGAVTSEGDAASRADLVRAEGNDGAGVRVGVISDGIDDLADAVAADELGVVTVPADARCRPGEGNEGTALLEVVHDLAPGADLVFSGAATSLEFIDAVHCLVAAGVQVVVDDLGFFGEPYFKDGPVAQTVREAVQAGVSWVSAAGNDAERHVAQQFRFTLCGDLHDFGGGGCVDHVLLAPFELLECTLQWNDPYRAAANDYDLELVDASLAPLATGNDVQDGTQDPIESATWSNPGPDPVTVGVRIRKVRGEPRLLKLFCLGGTMERVTPGGSIFGHAALPEVLAVGAIDVHDPGLDTVEPYSSRGPVEIFFPIATRPKPDLVAFDGVATAVPAYAPFFGTSAAAPHVAAAAALLRRKNPFLTPAELHAVLRATAVDVALRGVDPVAGAGRLDAFAAAAAVVAPECIGAADCGGACLIDTCNAGTCAHDAVRGRASRACDGQPVPKGIGVRFDRACRLVARVPSAAGPRRAKRLVRRALNALARAIRITARAGENRVSPECAASIIDALHSAEMLIGPRAQSQATTHCPNEGTHVFDVLGHEAVGEHDVKRVVRVRSERSGRPIGEGDRRSENGLIDARAGRARIRLQQDRL